ncbi:MAG: acyl-CoA thioesterase [Flavobacteriaceae bacterium]|nr:acyl-CoA thioesterase [Flavobacteriaceae bacterium]
MKKPKKASSKALIRFQDCDPFNHLNNGNYINYFMNHREDMLIEHYGVDVYKMAKELGKSWLSGSNQIAYLKPAFLMEKVTIESRLIRYTDSELVVEMKMYNDDKTQLKSVLWASFVHYNLLKQKRDKHTEELMELFEEIHTPVVQQTFEERINQIKSKMYHSV